MIALFDNEEVGSNSSMVRAATPRRLRQYPPAGWRMPAVCVCIIWAQVAHSLRTYPCALCPVYYQGAGGPVMMDTIKRITEVIAASSSGASAALPHEAHVRAVQRSFLVSADMAHALHPNYPEKHDPALQPTLGGGMVIKTNLEQRYATSAVSGFFFRACAAKAEGEEELPFQEYAVPADCPCGSTIGPVLSAATGIRCVDVGPAQWSMHSVSRPGPTRIINSEHFPFAFLVLVCVATILRLSCI